MGYSDKFFHALGINPKCRGEISAFAKKSGVSTKSLKYYNEKNLIPSGKDLDKIVEFSGVSLDALKIKMGRVDGRLLDRLMKSSDKILQLLSEDDRCKEVVGNHHKPDFSTDLGDLYRGDCLELFKGVESDSVDVVFADPPFNLSKIYPSGMDDNIKAESYINWCGDWIEECVRVLKPGGSLFLWNIPKWNVELSHFLNSRMSFKHWISVDVKYSLPIKGRLYPSHYSLLYYVKGEKANTFNPDRLPMQTCPVCYGDLKDYGGYKDKMNPDGVSLTDVWWDISPVRHSKYKKRDGSNELPLKLMDRIVEMSSKEGDVILDPFAGSGTTCIASELKSRKWIGFELGPLDIIEDRFSGISQEEKYLMEIRAGVNALFPEKIKKKRKSKGLWTCETFHPKSGDVEYEKREDKKNMHLDLKLM